MINKFIIKLPNPKKQFGKPVIFKRRKPKQSNIFNLDRISDIYNHISNYNKKHKEKKMRDCRIFSIAYFEISKPQIFNPFILDFNSFNK